MSGARSSLGLPPLLSQRTLYTYRTMSLSLWALVSLMGAGHSVHDLKKWGLSTPIINHRNSFVLPNSFPQVRMIVNHLGLPGKQVLPHGWRHKRETDLHRLHRQLYYTIPFFSILHIPYPLLPLLHWHNSGACVSVLKPFCSFPLQKRWFQARKIGSTPNLLVSDGAREKGSEKCRCLCWCLSHWAYNIALYCSLYLNI